MPDFGRDDYSDDGRTIIGWVVVGRIDERLTVGKLLVMWMLLLMVIHLLLSAVAVVGSIVTVIVVVIKAVEACAEQSRSIFPHTLMI